MKCAICKGSATKKVIWADGRAYQPSCEGHVRQVQAMLTKKNGKMTELAGVQDLSEPIDLVSSHVYPGLERKPGGPDNWVEAAGGLPSYIERIAKHLHYERGYSISRAIATAVNTVKRWAKGGTVTKHGTTKRVSAKTVALAAKAVAEWTAKKAAGDLRLSEALLAVIDLAIEDDSHAFDLLDLADADISDTDTMVALMLPKEVASKIAVEGGIPVEDMHVTLTFHGEVDDAKFAQLVDDLKVWAADIPTGPNLKGTLGGLGCFPAGDPEKGKPWWVPVDIPGINTLHEQIKAVADRSAPAAENHGYTPHSTLVYGDEAPEPVESTPVQFSSIWVVRGNKERIEIPLGTQTGADLSEHAILSTSDIELPRGMVDIKALAKRAGQIDDPVRRAAVRQQILDMAQADGPTVFDLASTIAPRNARGRAKDGRRSYRGQGKWKHGFIPVNRSAKESKAKGSPIAIKRLNRLFGQDKAADDVRKSTREVQSTNKAVRRVEAAVGRAGGRGAGGRKANAKVAGVDEKSNPTAEKANDVAFFRHQGAGNKNLKPTKDNTLPDSQKEASKSTRIPKRARQNWDEIPESLKTVRNGKRYVLAEFGGKGYLTEWVGGVERVSAAPQSETKVMRTLSSVDAANMSPAALQALVNNPKSSEAVKKVARKALRTKAKEPSRG